MKLSHTPLRIMSWLAWATVGTIVLTGPLVYFGISYQFIAGGLEAEAEMNAHAISQLISKNPDMWTYEQLRLSELLSRSHQKGRGGITQRVVDTHNRVIAERIEKSSSPVITRSSPLLDAGEMVGRIEVERSLRPLLLGTAVVALAGLFLGALLLAAFHFLPLRAMRKAERSLRESEEKYRSLLESSEDSIYLLDRTYRYLFMNRTQRLRLGLGEAQYEGRAYSDFHAPETTKEFSEYAEKVFHTGENIRYEHKSHRDGRHFLRTLSPVKARDGHIYAITVISKDITALKHLEEELRTLSLRDELTGLYNRRGFFVLSEHLLKVANRSMKGMFMLYADMDGLKALNDTCSHQAGDKALIEVARLLRETFRDSDIIARVGGDEFVVFPVGIEGDNVEVITARLQKGVELHNTKMNAHPTLSVSAGVSYYNPGSPCSIDELLFQADKSMYDQKRVRQPLK